MDIFTPQRHNVHITYMTANTHAYLTPNIAGQEHYTGAHTSLFWTSLNLLSRKLTAWLQIQPAERTIQELTLLLFFMFFTPNFLLSHYTSSMNAMHVEASYFYIPHGILFFVSPHNDSNIASSQSSYVLYLF